MIRLHVNRTAHVVCDFNSFVESEGFQGRG